MGTGSSRLVEDIGDKFPDDEHYFGLVNFGNTCYCNSVLQALYFCRPFREKVLIHRQQQKHSRKDSLLNCLSELFHMIATQKKRVGKIAPKKFVSKLRKENEAFNNFMQQDAHEFLNYLLNTIAETVQAFGTYKQKCNEAYSTSDFTLNSFKFNCNIFQDILRDIIYNPASVKEGGGRDLVDKRMDNSTWVHDIFQGTLTNETRCLNCETVSSKDEDFLDLSIDIEGNTSVSHCLQLFSNTETLKTEHKYFCEVCCSKQEAQKRMGIKKLPQVLALHLKRFKYMEQLQRFIKLSYRVVFPFELRLFNTIKDASNPERLYDLTAIVVHCGVGMNRGHYISLVKSHGFWLLFDDDNVEKVEAQSIEDFYGLASEAQKGSSESGYILFYQSRE